MGKDARRPAYSVTEHTSPLVVPLRKALKPGAVYHFGRKAPADLILADKTVSRESATIRVGQYQPSGEEHPPPSLVVHALKRVVRVIAEEDEDEWKKDKDNFIGEVVQPDSDRQLQSGDTIALTKSAPSVK